MRIPLYGGICQLFAAVLSVNHWTVPSWVSMIVATMPAGRRALVVAESTASFLSAPLAMKIACLAPCRARSVRVIRSAGGLGESCTGITRSDVGVMPTCPGNSDSV